MFDAMRSKFYKKSKSLLKLSKTRVETVKKKRFAVHKYLKNDIAELLRNGLDVNAYGRVDGFLVEQNISFCYEFIEQCISTIYNQLSNMENQRECPDECKEAVASLMYAAARLADLPEVRELRTVFTERYGNSLENFVSKEFVGKLSSEPPSQERKIQIMQEIAQEYSIRWDPRSLRQELFKRTPPVQDKHMHGSFHDTKNDGYNRHKRKDDAFSVRDGHNGGEKMSDVRGHDVPTPQRRKDNPYDRYNVPSSSEDEVVSNYKRDSSSQDSQQTGSSSVGSVSEDEVDSRKPVHYGFIPPPYVKRNIAKGGSNIEEPMRSNDHVNAEQNNYKDAPVTKSNLKPPPGREIAGNGMKAQKVSPRLQSILDGGDESDEEEKKMDQLLMHYSKKKTYLPPGKESDDNYGATRHRNARANLYPPIGQESDDTNRVTSRRSTRANQYPPAGQEIDASYGATRCRNERANQYPPPGLDSDDTYGASRHRSARANQYTPPGQDNDDTYGAARHRSSRPHNYPSQGQEYDDTYGTTRHRSSRGNLYPPPGNDDTGGPRHRSAKSDLPVAPARASSISPEQTAKYEAPKGHARANSLQPEMLAGHVHPKLPDYDDLAARLAALRGR